MASLSRERRKQLERVVRDARRVAEEGARQALRQLGVHAPDAPPELTAGQRSLRNRLRAHGRQLGDVRDPRSGQGIDRLAAECAYEAWHRMLFARFLAENELLIEPTSGQPISLADCKELASEQRRDWIGLAGELAMKMLPQIFRPGDPVLDVALPPEKRQELETLLESLSEEVFLADDSLGWVYQFWQADLKDRVNSSETKIGADELPAVTQLFTEDYMVLFLLHNTLGAWWAGRVLAARPALAREASSEAELRRACALPGVDWAYLRFVKENGSWRPASGTYAGWPATARKLTVLDPCMGSGHFLVFALPILVALRMSEEALALPEAVDAALRDNLFGLELDPRCTQLAAFNLAFCAWRQSGYRKLPPFNLACSGLPIMARQQDWTSLAGSNEAARVAMEKLYDLFRSAPVLGSLIDPQRVGGDLFTSCFRDVRDHLIHALAAETHTDEEVAELAVAARGIVDAARLLTSRFTLVATNVPYLGQRKQGPTLRQYVDEHHPLSKAELGACFIERGLSFCNPGGTVALVTLQTWLFLSSYTALRENLLRNRQLGLIGVLGPRAFETITGEVVNVALVVVSAVSPPLESPLAMVDVSDERTPGEKSRALVVTDLVQRPQREQRGNPDSRILVDCQSFVGPLLGDVTLNPQGIKTGDDARWRRSWWELDSIRDGWKPYQSTVERDILYGGREYVIDWRTGGRGMVRPRVDNVAKGRRGVVVSAVGSLATTLYSGDHFESSAAVVVPRDVKHFLPVWAFCTSDEFKEGVRRIDKTVAVTTNTVVKVPFDLALWSRRADEIFPNGFPSPFSDDPTQWVFHGHPFGSVVWNQTRRCTEIGAPRLGTSTLQVAIARLLGYRWPAELDDEIELAAEQRAWVTRCAALDAHADEDGIVCLVALRGEPRAAERLHALLADAWEGSWTAAHQNALLAAAGFVGRTLDDWLRDGFFAQHVQRFQQRPFVWHVWDGRDDGFGALVNYHRLAAPDGGGRRTLEKLLFHYLGDWIDRQRADQKAGVEGSDARLAAAEHLRAELQRILEGDPPYDIFVRWKPLHEQPIGWDPDINDGVRLNIRPFMTARPLKTRGKNACILRTTPNVRWDKDRGKEVERDKDDFPWFWGWDEESIDFTGGREFDGIRWNDLHYSRAAKQAARDRVRTAGRRGGHR